MVNQSSDGSAKTFTVVMRGPSAIVFRQDQPLRVVGFPSTAGPVNMTYQSRWIKRGPDVTVPGHLWVEVQGKGQFLKESVVPFANAGWALLPLLSLSTNAAIGDPEVEVAFDSTPGASEREYFQSYVAPESWHICTARLIHVDATAALVSAVARNPDGEQLRRAANQYRLALDSWRLGRETLSLAHLWMALEALTPAKIFAERQARGMCPKEDLADALGVAREKGWKGRLCAVVRKDLLLNGDAECYRKSKDASDGLEHGYRAYEEIAELSRDVRHRMAGYVRTAILTLSGLAGGALEVLTKDPFDKPLGHWPLAKYVRGRLVGSKSELGAEGNAYPFLRWKTKIKECGVGEDGALHMKLDEELTPELAEGISFEGGSWEVWKPG
jgi:hypothetical protein